MKATYLVFLCGLSLSCAGSQTRNNGPMTGESYDSPGEDSETRASDELTPEEEASADAERLHPMCDLAEAPPEFPTKSEGMAFRAWVRFTIAADGRAEGTCYAKVEGLHKYEEKAMADRGQWEFDKKYAGEPRERLVTYRKNPPKP